MDCFATLAIMAVMTKILKRNPADYVQVEPDYYCLAARELSR